MSTAATGVHGNDHDAHGHDDHPAHLQHHFDSSAQQESAAKLGMWVFLGTEILMFSGLFLAYFVLRGMYPEMVLEAHETLNKELGSVNTVVLILSSLTMALAVRAAQTNQKERTNQLLLITLLCAGAFMVIKYIEYSAKFEHGTLPGTYYAEHIAYDVERGVELVQKGWYGGNQLFFGVYFVMTGLHGVHVLVGMGLIIWMMKMNHDGRLHSGYYTPIENVGLYWHIVDLVWIFLFPLLYLVK